MFFAMTQTDKKIKKSYPVPNWIAFRRKLLSLRLDRFRANLYQSATDAYAAKSSSSFKYFNSSLKL
jgi:hypothetical protein